MAELRRGELRTDARESGDVRRNPAFSLRAVTLRTRELLEHVAACCHGRTHDHGRRSGHGSHCSGRLVSDHPTDQSRRHQQCEEKEPDHRIPSAGGETALTHTAKTRPRPTIRSTDDRGKEPQARSRSSPRATDRMCDLQSRRLPEERCTRTRRRPAGRFRSSSRAAVRARRRWGSAAERRGTHARGHVRWRRSGLRLGAAAGPDKERRPPLRADAPRDHQRPGSRIQLPAMRLARGSQRSCAPPIAQGLSD